MLILEFASLNTLVHSACSGKQEQYQCASAKEATLSAICLFDRLCLTCLRTLTTHWHKERLLQCGQICYKSLLTDVA